MDALQEKIKRETPKTKMKEKRLITKAGEKHHKS